MVRLTIHDSEKTVSFLGDEHQARCLVAGCASEPDLLEDLLIAAEPHCPGNVANVIQGLVRFDHAITDQHTLTLSGPFEVMDPGMDRVAYIPDRSGLLAIDLADKAISSTLGSGVLLGGRGSIRIERVTSGLDRETIYALSDAWTVSVITEHNVPSHERAYV